MVNMIGGVFSSSEEYLLKMWHVDVPAGERAFHKHSHTQFEITLIESGSGIYTSGTKNYRISSGDMMIFSSNELHCITDVSPVGLRITNLHFEPRYLWGGSSDSLSDRHINFCFSHSPSFENHIPKENATELRNLIRKMQAELENGQPEYPLMIKSYLNTLLVSLIRDYGYADDGVSVSRSNVHSIKKAVNYIDKNLFDVLTLEDISKVANLSANYFSSLFRKINNMTLWDYITSKRIDEAIKLITSDKGENILDVAVKCGFNNTANFNKAFKRFTGMTPSEYREAGDILIH